MLSTKDSNSINEITGRKASILSSKASDIFADGNYYHDSSLIGVNRFRASDRSSFKSSNSHNVLFSLR